MQSSSLVPRDKHDFERVNALIQAGPDAAAPVLEELLVWLQDMNWPIAQPLADFLVSVGPPLIPHLKKVLGSRDEMWIYWVLSSVVDRLPAGVIRELRSSLEALVLPAENDLLALRIGTSNCAWDAQTLERLVANRLPQAEELVSELKAIKSGLAGQ